MVASNGAWEIRPPSLSIVMANGDALEMMGQVDMGPFYRKHQLHVSCSGPRSTYTAVCI